MNVSSTEFQSPQQSLNQDTNKNPSVCKTKSRLFFNVNQNVMKIDVWQRWLTPLRFDSLPPH